MVQICVNKSAYLGVTYASVFSTTNFTTTFPGSSLVPFLDIVGYSYMSSKHFVRQGKKAFVQQYQKLYSLLMKVSMVFQYLQASKRRWLALHQILWSLLFQRLIVIPKVPFTFYIKSFAFGRLVFQ